jgi:PAT family beta-lactamase induction signal transducer AmpG
LFAFLIAPTAVIAIGLVDGALSFLLRREGIGPARSASIVALLGIPHAIYFLWCPFTDFWMRRRTWVLTAAFVAAAVVALAFHQPALGSAWSIRLLFAAFCLALLVAASTGGIMGELRSERNRRLAGSFYQCGSLVVGGLAVFTLVSLSGHVPLGTLGWIVAVMIALPALAAFAAPSGRPPGQHSARATAARILGEFRSTFLRWEAIPYTLLITMPICSGAMIGLLPALAADFGVGAAQVAWMNGLAGALITAAGSLAASRIPIRVPAPVAYLSVGLLDAATLSIFALGPLRPWVYFLGTALYLFIVGAGYALFTGVVLEFMGDSGKSGSARYSIINSLGNLPVAYMAWADGRGYAHWGARGMPGIDAALSATVATALLLYFVLRQRKRIRPQL